MTKKILYERVGRKYVPVREYDPVLIDALPKGNHLISVHPGGRSDRYNVDPNYVAMIAAGRIAEDAISKHIMEVSSLRVPEQRKPLTAEQQAAWENLSATFGEERFALEWCSYREAAKSAVEVMQKEAEKLMTNESVRKAYDHFMLMCKLANEKV